MDRGRRRAEPKLMHTAKEQSQVLRVGGGRERGAGREEK